MSARLLKLGAAGAAAALLHGLWTTQRQSMLHPSYWEQWQVRELEDPLVWVVLGDSASQGVGVADPGDAWVGLTARRLEAELARPVRVVNLAISGCRARHVIERQLPRLAALLRTQPVDLVTCVIGGNDVVKPGYDPTRFAEEMELIAQGLPDAAVLGEVPYFGELYAFHERRARRLNDIVRGVAARHPELVLATMHDEMAGLWRQEHVKTVAGDLFHPNARGYRLWARFLGEGIDEALRRRQVRRARPGLIRPAGSPAPRRARRA